MAIGIVTQHLAVIFLHNSSVVLLLSFCVRCGFWMVGCYSRMISYQVGAESDNKTSLQKVVQVVCLVHPSTMHGTDMHFTDVTKMPSKPWRPNT